MLGGVGRPNLSPLPVYTMACESRYLVSPVWRIVDEYEVSKLGEETVSVVLSDPDAGLSCGWLQ
jgi:hypothetical protein